MPRPDVGPAWRPVLDVADRAEGVVERLVIGMFEAGRARVDVDALARALERGDRAAAERIAFASAPTPDDEAALATLFLDIMERSAESTRGALRPAGDRAEQVRRAYMPATSERQAALERAVAEVGLALGLPAVGGVEPVDLFGVSGGRRHGVSVSVFSDQASSLLAVPARVRRRRMAWARRRRAVLHVVAVDERADSLPAAYGGSRMRYARGASVRSLGDMLPVVDPVQLRWLLARPAAGIARELAMAG